MALVIPAGYGNLIITINNTLAGASAVSSIALGVKDNNVEWTSGDRSSIANACRDALTPLVDNSFLLGPVKMIQNVSGVLKVNTDTGTEAGTATTTPYAPPSVAHVVSKGTGQLGRAFRGRFYFPGVPEADVNEGGELTGTRVNDVTAAFTDLQADLEALVPIVACVLLHDENSPGAHPPTVITSMFCRTIVGNMRPRQRR